MMNSLSGEGNIFREARVSRASHLSARILTAPAPLSPRNGTGLTAKKGMSSASRRCARDSAVVADPPREPPLLQVQQTRQFHPSASQFIRNWGGARVGWEGCVFRRRIDLQLLPAADAVAVPAASDLRAAQPLPDSSHGSMDACRRLPPSAPPSLPPSATGLVGWCVSPSQRQHVRRACLHPVADADGRTTRVKQVVGRLVLPHSFVRPFVCLQNRQRW